MTLQSLKLHTVMVLAAFFQTLVLMGAATTLIAFLPTYATAEVMASVLLLLLRILQESQPAANGEEPC